MSDVPSIAHKGDWQAEHFHPGGAVPWQERDGRRHCAYCGSLHPSDLDAALGAGASLGWADRKYGWPHKAYITGGGVQHAKFYTVHLQDATELERAVIHAAMGLKFTFKDGGKVAWEPAS